MVRVYDPNVSNYQFKPDEIFWKTINRPALKSMLDKTLKTLSDENKVNKAWNKVLTGLPNGKIQGKKVIVKVNFNNTIRDINTVLNNSPAMIMALAQSLIDAGISESNITIFDHHDNFQRNLKLLFNQTISKN